MDGAVVGLGVLVVMVVCGKRLGVGLSGQTVLLWMSVVLFLAAMVVPVVLVGTMEMKDMDRMRWWTTLAGLAGAGGWLHLTLAAVLAARAD